MHILDCEYLWNGDKSSKNYYRHQTASHIWPFDWHLHLTLTHSKGRGQGHAQLDSEYLGNGDRSGKIIIAIKEQVIYWIVDILKRVTYRKNITIAVQ